MSKNTTIRAADLKDVRELQTKIDRFNKGQIDEERFKLYRLTRGVYGQRQQGVQMFRTKIPFGRLNTEQLIRIADMAETYTNGNLHITTRQDIQLHHIRLEDTPAIWRALAETGITAREACGNTVRNITASAKAGIDPAEPFDVIPYAQAVYHYFLRNPICQDMGRKIKIAFSSSAEDSAFTYFHDFGFVPLIRQKNGEAVRGFKVVVGGGLGAQSIIAQTAFDFLETDRIIPFLEAALRIFDRHGEREKRFKARMKFLIRKLGLPTWLDMVREEQKALNHFEYEIDRTTAEVDLPAPSLPSTTPRFQESAYQQWLSTNVFEQKQSGYFGVWIKVFLGDIDAQRARRLATVVRQFAADDIRLTVNQGMLLRFVTQAALPFLFAELQALELAEPGFGRVTDITACPGTDTCNLGVTNSTGLAGRLEEVIRDEYPDLIYERHLHIKISGCMNACGQHMVANIGFHGSSIKREGKVIPAMQVVLGGGLNSEGGGFIAEKVIKLPTRRIPLALRAVLDDYVSNASDTEYFNDYYYRLGKRYFYDLLRDLSQTEDVLDSEYMDWGQDHLYKQAIGVGECAGVVMDVVGAIIRDAQEKILLSKESQLSEHWRDSLYFSYTAFIIGAKALLLSQDIRCNTHIGILRDFDQHFTEKGIWATDGSFERFVLRMRDMAPTRIDAERYYADAKAFLEFVVTQHQDRGLDAKRVIGSHYKA